MPLAAPDASPFSVVHRVFGSLPKFSPKTRQDSVTDELAQKFSKGVIAVEEERHRQLRMLEVLYYYLLVYCFWYNYFVDLCVLVCFR